MTHIPHTVSPEAQRVLAELTPGLVPGPLTTEGARQIREANALLRAEMLDPLLETIVASTEQRTIAGVPVLTITPENNRNAAAGKVALHIHGGAYCFGVALSLPGCLMADELGMPVHALDYRLAPEHPFPAGIDDCFGVYRAVTEQTDARDIVIFGESAGGGMVLKLLIRARDAGLPLPAAVALLSPWSDLTHAGDSYVGNEGRDPILTWNGQLAPSVRAYAGSADPACPALSPLYADYTKGFPPTLITTGTRDLFLSNSIRLERVMRRAGIDVRTHVWEGMWHAFDAAPRCPEGRESRSEIASFLLERLGLEP